MAHIINYFLPKNERWDKKTIFEDKACDFPPMREACVVYKSYQYEFVFCCF